MHQPRWPGVAHGLCLNTVLSSPSPLSQIHARSTKHHKWLVMLDAAAHVPTHPLDLSKVKPDFVPISFYKMLGLPTGKRHT